MAATNRETEMLNSIARETAASLVVGEIARSAVGHLRELVPFESSLMVLDDGGLLHVVYADEAQQQFAREIEALPISAVSEAFRESLLTRPVSVLRLPDDESAPLG